ncbi:MAG TPA: M14 family zinc carboxypeptidase [Xanthobacteraceae bacterium]|nr:M14 family zinc carboxypeptidase [Xanthobacteraceae bacterium]
MPLTGYLTASAIEAGLVHLATKHPTICELIVLTEPSIEGRTIRAVKIGDRGRSARPGILVIAGAHAREVVNPDMLLMLGVKLCKANADQTGLAFGGKIYSASALKSLMDATDLYFLPLVNPDGRNFVQSPTGDPMWRKNRNPNPGRPARGVDLNRNYDFLWSSGIGTSSNSNSDTYKGAALFSEPETRNVRAMLDAYPNIRMLLDVHSYSELVLYPWGDDNNQTTDPSMSFRNPTFDGLRGSLGDNVYREYIPAQDLEWFVRNSARIRDAIALVRGRVYTAEQSPDLYPTTATSEDYAFTRHFVDGSKPRVRGLTVETGTEFQPAFPEAANVMNEGAVAVLEACQINLEEGELAIAGRLAATACGGVARS